MVSVDERVRSLLDAGDERAAVTVAIEALGPAIFTSLCTLHDEDDAADVYQDWAEDLWAGLRGFRWHCTLRTWAYRLAWNASVRFRRVAWRRRRTRLRTSVASRIAASAVGSGVRRGRDERLDPLFAVLGPEDRMLLLLRLKAEMTWDEIATVLRRAGTVVSAPTLRKRFERLKDRLREIAQDKGLLG